MKRQFLRILGVVVIGSLLLFSVVPAGAFTVNVEPLTEDGVLRVLFYGGLKGNIAPCG